MAYVKLVRPHWFLASTLATMIGIFQAWAEGSYHLALAVLVIVGVILHHAIMETWDELKDYAHYREEVVTDSTEPPTLFSGGSGVLTGQLLTVSQVWRFFYAMISVAVIVLGGIIDLAGWQVLLCVAAGVLVMVNYNSMVKLSYRGFGEFANFISFGPIMVCSTFVVLRLGASGAHEGGRGWNLLSFLNATTVTESVIVGAIWFGSLHIQEMLDYEEDRAGNKRTLVVRFGKAYASRVPAATAAVIVALTVYLSTVDLGFLIILPAVVVHLCETASFITRWRDEAYFMRKMKSFFVYRNFVLICVSILLSFFFRRLPHAAGTSALLSLVVLTAASSVPAMAFLARNRLFAFAVAGRVS
jgi:1,4-dihydroxy-2-naphthoate octaprenyltransferase